MNDEQFDNKLFNLSQADAASSPMVFNEAAWKKMELLLDVEKKKPRFIIWWWLLPLALLTGGIGVYFISSKIITNSDKISQINTNTNTTETATETQLKENNITGISKGNSSLSSVATLQNHFKKTTETNIESNDKTVSTHSQIIVKKSIQTNPNIELVISEKIPSKTKVAAEKIGLDKNESISSSNQLKQLASTVELQLKPDSNAIQTDKQTALKNNAENLITLISQPKTTIAKADSIVFKKAVISTDSVAKKADVALPTTKQSFLSKFELSAFIAGDATTAKFKKVEKLSGTYGFGLNYAITKKLSIASGFAITRKLYVGDSIDYQKQATLPATYKLQSVDANCLVYEVPLNIQYQFRQNKKNSWVAIGGVSAYFMKNESYDYNYLWNGQPRKSNWTIENKNNQLFSILNLAVGYRRQFSKQLSYQIAPFLKVPLTGIGEGKVKLYSAGLQLSINLKGK